MRRKLEVLFGGALLASALLLGGCIAPAADDESEDVGASGADLVLTEIDGDDPATPDTRAATTTTTTDAAGTFKGSDCASDPQPNPWRPDGDPGLKPQHNQR